MKGILGVFYSMTQSPINLNIKKIKLLDKYLINPVGLYTGMAIKKYFTKFVVNRYNIELSSSLQSGRYSAYAHNQLFSSFQNIITKHNLGIANHLLVHPLLEAQMLNYLESLNAKISFQDIDKSSLNLTTNFLKLNLIKYKNLKQPVDHIILICHSGLSDEVIEQVQLANSMDIKVIIIFPNSVITPQNYEVLTKLRLGSIIFNMGEDFLASHLSQVVVTPDSFLPRIWFLGIYIETRASSVLEYHLKDSQNIYYNLLDKYLILLRKKEGSVNLMSTFSGIMDTVFSNEPKDLRKVINRKKVDFNQIKLDLEQLYKESLTLAIPDAVFDIENSFSQKEEKKESYKDFLVSVQSEAARWHDYFSKVLRLRPVNSLEIPIFYRSKYYSSYFVYSTDFDYYKKSLIGRNNINYGIHLSPSALSQNLPNSHFVANYIIRIELGGNSLA